MRIAETLGIALSKTRFGDTMQFGQSYKDILTEGNECAISSECHNVVKTFAQALCAATDKARKNPKIYLALEQLYSAQNEKVVGPVTCAQEVKRHATFCPISPHQAHATQ